MKKENNIQKSPLKSPRGGVPVCRFHAQAGHAKNSMCSRYFSPAGFDSARIWSRDQSPPSRIPYDLARSTVDSMPNYFGHPSKSIDRQTLAHSRTNCVEETKENVKQSVNVYLPDSAIDGQLSRGARLTYMFWWPIVDAATHDSSLRLNPKCGRSFRAHFHHCRLARRWRADDATLDSFSNSSLSWLRCSRALLVDRCLGDVECHALWVKFEEKNPTASMKLNQKYFNKIQSKVLVILPVLPDGIIRRVQF